MATPPQTLAVRVRVLNAHKLYRKALIRVDYEVRCCLSSADCLVRTDSALPVRRGSERLKWPCVSGIKSTTWSVSNAPPVRSTSASATATCSSTRTSCVSRTFLSGPNSTAAYASFPLRLHNLVLQKSTIRPPSMQFYSIEFQMSCRSPALNQHFISLGLTSWSQFLMYEGNKAVSQTQTVYKYN